jgi:hypothetical protein
VALSFFICVLAWGQARAQAVPEAPLARLAALLADELTRVAPDAAFELPPLEDRTTSAAGTVAADLRELVARRLDEHARPSDRRVRVAAILSQAGPRLIVSARVEELPAGRLLDVVSVSIEADPARLNLAASPAVAPSREVEVVSSLRSAPLDDAVLDLAWVGDERLLLLSPGALALYRATAGAFTLESRQELPGPALPVRAPGGLLWPRERSVWALSTRAARAALFEHDGSRLREVSQADSLPLPDVPHGLRARAGTNQFDADLPGVGPGPWLAVEPAWPEGAVSAEAELLLAGENGPRRTGLRVGPALAPLWPGLMAAVSADAPGAHDAVLLLRLEGGGAREAGRLAVEGAARALAALTVEGGARLIAAVEEPGGGYHLELFELRRPDAGAELP